MGRKKGSKNKSTLKKEKETIQLLKSSEQLSEKEVKKEIRELKKLKNLMQTGSKDRIELHRKIKKLKESLKERLILDDDKRDIVKEILKHKPSYVKNANINYNKFSKEQLERHLNRLKGENK